MPMLFAGVKPHDISRTDFLDWTAVALYPAASSRDDERLTERMGYAKQCVRPART